ncbi:MAG: TetR/AcrR family transcriptional regulator [Clostridia bacterium]|nr:TetR/AcrR family transcriptional regulator [Clostridia bacterium]
MSSSDTKFRNTALKMQDAMIDLLFEKHFTQITIMDVCRRAGVNRSTFYAHYQNLSELQNEALSEKLIDLWRKTRRISHDRFHFNVAYLEAFLEFIKANRNLIYIINNNVESPVGVDIYRTLKRYMRDGFYDMGVIDENEKEACEK